MKISRTKKVIEDRFLRPKSPPVFLWGPPGIGKSQAVEQVAKENDMGFIDFRLAQVDPVDIRGPLMKTTSEKEFKTEIVEDDEELQEYSSKGYECQPLGDGRFLMKKEVEEQNKMEWLSPSMFPDEGEGILFLDELNLAPTAIQNAAYQLVFKNKIGEYELPDGWTVIAAGNKEEHAQVFSMQPPLRNRLFHAEIEPNIEDWRDWALDQTMDKTWAVNDKINPMVLGYLGKQPQDLFDFNPERDQINYPSPRSWELVSYLLDTGSPYSDLKGALGEGAASKFIGFLRTAEDMPDIDRILGGEDIIPERTDIKWAVSSGLISRVKDDPNHLGRLFEYALKLGQDEKGGKEFAVLIGRDAFRAGLNPSDSDRSSKCNEAFIDYAEEFGDYITQSYSM